ncbi:unnamed protein product [Sphagnum jensenii]|uniref:Uncharacterized protein n=1 Tax=Sphagnum jensenii TaxID=128206 RepID=A0ABP1AED8_9BRYO
MLLGRCGRSCHHGLPDCLILLSMSSSFQARQTAYNLVLMMERPPSRRGNHMQFHEGIAATLPQKDLGMILVGKKFSLTLARSLEFLVITAVKLGTNWPCTLFHSLEV